MTGCDECDWHGPEIGDTFEAKWRELHRAMHDFGRAVLTECRRLAKWRGEQA